eukprot:IDg15354t1
MESQDLTRLKHWAIVHLRHRVVLGLDFCFDGGVVCGNYLDLNRYYTGIRIPPICTNWIDTRFCLRVLVVARALLVPLGDQSGVFDV